MNSSGLLDFIPNDSLNQEQIHLNHPYASLELEAVWDITDGDSSIVVAVIDGFVDWEHPDLGYDGISIHENMWKNPRELKWSNSNIPSNNSIDYDNNGYIGDWRGWDFYYNTNDTRPRTQLDNHGTNVAGIIAGKTNNEIGISGIAGGNYQINNENRGGVQVMPINVCKSKDSIKGSVDLQVWHVAKAIDYAMKNDANIIALSLSLGEYNYNSNVLDKVIDEAYN